MSIRFNVMLLLGISLGLSLFISLLSIHGADEVENRALKFSQSAQIDVGLARSLATATTTIKADPISPDTGPLLKRVNQAVLANLKQARESQLSRDDKPFLMALDQTQTAWTDYYQHSMNLFNMAETDPASAIGMIESVYQTRFIPFQQEFSKTIELGQKQGARLQNGIDQSIHQQRLLILLPLGLTALLLLGLMISFLLSLSRSVKRFQTSSEYLSEGNLTTRFQDRKRDEFSQIGQAVNRFLNPFVTTLQAVRHAVAKSDHVVTHLRQITDEVERNILTQNHETTQMVTAVEQLSASFRRVADMSAKARQTAENGEQIVVEGARMGQATITALKSIDETVATTGVMMAQLDQAIRQVTQVTKSIQSISEQTTLLALNAAIEAARAGAQGRGFAVVANEVKQLSNRTKSLTIDITDIVATVQGSSRNVQETLDSVRTAVTQGVASGESTGKLLSDIDVSMRSVADMLRDIALSTDEQSAVTVDMTDRIDLVSRGSVLMREKMGSVINVMAQLEGASAQLHHHLDAFTISRDEVSHEAGGDLAPFDIRVPGLDTPRPTNRPRSHAEKWNSTEPEEMRSVRG